jgi:hypothetical protein
MSDKERRLEQNTARLIQAALDPRARPSSQASRQTFRALLVRMRERPGPVDFPDAAVASLGTILVLVGIWLAIRVVVMDAPVLASPSLLVMAAWLVANLALVPVASIVILIRRQREQ